MDDDAPPGVPEWVVTYGDMMSLLLTFFIMLVSMSEVVADQKYRAVVEALQKYIGYDAAPAAPPGKRFPLNSLVERLSTLGSHRKGGEGRGGVRNESPPGQNTQLFHTAQGKGVPVGEPITFASGSVNLSPSAERQLQQVAESFAGIPNKIEIIGHVAPDPEHAERRPGDTLQISYLRAKAVFDHLVKHGVIVERMRLRAAGDLEPLPANGDRRSLQNDRVEIQLIDKFADHYQGSRQGTKD